MSRPLSRMRNYELRQEVKAERARFDKLLADYKMLAIDARILARAQLARHTDLCGCYECQRAHGVLCKPAPQRELNL